VLPHQIGHVLSAAWHSSLLQLLVDPGTAISAAALFVGGSDQLKKTLVFDSPFKPRLLGPGVEPAAVNPKNPAHHHNPVLVPVRADERVLYSGSFAKYAAAFFKISRSS
jgi:hypothetical protein